MTIEEAWRVVEEIKAKKAPEEFFLTYHPDSNAWCAGFMECVGLSCEMAVSMECIGDTMPEAIQFLYDALNDR